MTPEHKFQLLITGITVFPATLIAIWALISQRRQTEPRLKVVPMPMMAETVTGKEVLVSPQWPGIVVRNVGAVQLRICNVGYRIGKKFHSFGKPVVFNADADSPWPWVLEPHARVGFHLDLFNDEGRKFMTAMTSQLNGKFLWEVGRAYAVTECGKWFYSKQLSRKSVRLLREVAPIAVGTKISGFKTHLDRQAG